MTHIAHIAPSRSGHFFIQNMIRSWLVGVPIYNAEDLVPRKLWKAPLKNNTIVVLQIRDLLNWYSSTVQANVNGRCTLSEDVLRYHFTIKTKIWWRTAKEFYGLTDYLSAFQVLRVDYDEFVKSPQIRKNICRELGGQYNEDRLNEIHKAGGGSSFDRFKYNNSGSVMNVLNRYQQISSEYYKYFDVLQQTQALQLYEKHMQLDEGKLSFLEKLYRVA